MGLNFLNLLLMKKGLAFLLFNVLAVCAVAQQSNRYYLDSLKHELVNAKEDTTKVQMLAGICQFYYTIAADTGVIYGKQALDLAEKIHYHNGIMQSEGMLAICLIISGNFPQGLGYAFKTLEEAKKRYPERIGWARSLVAYCYHYLGEHKTFLDYTLESMKTVSDWELPYGWRDLALAYNSLNEPDSAIGYAKKAFDAMKGSQDEGLISYITGDAYAGKKMYDSALVYYRNGVLQSIKYQIKVDLIDNYISMAQAYKGIGRLDSGALYCNKVLAEKIEKQYPVNLARAAGILADIYQLQHQPDSALKYLRLATNTKDSLFSREKTNAVQNIVSKEEEKQKELEASELKYKNRLKIYLLIAGLVAVLIIAGILLKNNSNKQKANIVLQQQKEKVENTLVDLKAAQAQLIQSEKMASLGELTAGIAHEIQNPLNFVNNFSEVNKELVDELELELKAAHIEAAMSIAKDLKENEEKIIFHGKRADNIVKGMLHHSRASKNIKEQTDINALCDEYLRLSYHGLRAKDKAFNSNFKTDFDPAIQQINIDRQDIGRVLLNIFNNAFYAVKGKPDPQVTVSTKKINNSVEIRVTDNGNGISQKNLDKIFQPFFTTKPTGQGTGLGLSISYDIIKVHHGNISAESDEGKGVTFIINLPA